MCCDWPDPDSRGLGHALQRVRENQSLRKNNSPEASGRQSWGLEEIIKVPALWFLQPTLVDYHGGSYATYVADLVDRPSLAPCPVSRMV